MSILNKRNTKLIKSPNKRRSSIQIQQNILNNYNRTFIDINVEKVNNSLYENCKIDYERKNKAKRTLLYLLNIKSKGIFCPEIIDYFKKIRESKIKVDELNVIKEENLEKSGKIIPKIDEEKPHKILPKLENQIVEKQDEKNKINNNKNKNESIEKNNDIIEENNIINKQKEPNFISKDIQNIIKDNDELKSKDSIENITNYNKESQDDNKLNEELTIDNKNETLYLNPKKTKKNSKKKNNKKEKKIDTIYNLQRSELQKYGNYHSSLRSAIQSNLGKKKLYKKK